MFPTAEVMRINKEKKFEEQLALTRKIQSLEKAGNKAAEYLKIGIDRNFYYKGDGNMKRLLIILMVLITFTTNVFSQTKKSVVDTLSVQKETALELLKEVELFTKFVFISDGFELEKKYSNNVILINSAITDITNCLTALEKEDFTLAKFTKISSEISEKLFRAKCKNRDCAKYYGVSFRLAEIYEILDEFTEEEQELLT